MGKKNKYEDIDKFLEANEVIKVPEEFISAAYITTLDGDEYLVSFEEAAEIFDSGPLSDQGIKNISAIIDVKAVRETVYQLAKQSLSHAKF